MTPLSACRYARRQPVENSYAIPEHVLSRKAGVSTVVLDCDSGHYYVLSEPEEEIWEGLRSGRPEAEIARRFHRRFGRGSGIGLREATEHVAEFLDQLEGASLIRRRGSARPS